jgi:hypothetical protein
MNRVRTPSRRAQEALIQEEEPRRRQPSLRRAPIARVMAPRPSPPHDNQPFAEEQQPRTASDLLLPATHSIDRCHLTRVCRFLPFTYTSMLVGSCTLFRRAWDAVMQEDKPYSLLLRILPLLEPLHCCRLTKPSCSNLLFFFSHSDSPHILLHNCKWVCALYRTHSRTAREVRMQDEDLRASHIDHHGLKRLRVRSRTARPSSHARHRLSHPIEIRNVIATSRLALNGDVYCVVFKQ